MKILKPILYCLLGFILAFVVLYFINNKGGEEEIITDKDVPIIELQATPEDVYIGDTVTYTVKSRVESDNESFENNRNFYYDFDGNGEWDLVTKKDSAVYIFDKAYENGVTPKAAVEFRGKLGQNEGNKIYVKQKTKPILLYNSIGNTVIFRDLSKGNLITREICFDTDECDAGNSSFKIVDPYLKEGTGSLFSKNDSFLRNYNNFGEHNVSIYLKDKYGNEEHENFVIETSNNRSTGKISSGINMITIPETVFTDGNPEVFLSKSLNYSILMYINNESGETCYVDTDISVDSNGDGKLDNDVDILCNKIAKIVYDSNYESVIGRIYFTSKNNIESKDFKVYIEQ